MTSLIFDVTVTAAGMAVLLAGGWLLVKAAARLSLAFGISPLIVGATVVALGTSSPELSVSMAAALEGSGGLAVGNIFGSNITNVLLVLGIASLIRPMDVHPSLLRWEMPVLGVATAAVILAGLSGMIGHVVGAALFVGLIIFVALSLLRHREEEVPHGGEEFTRAREPLSRWGITREIALLVVGIGALALGSALTVEGSVRIAERVGLSDVAIGLTIVAIGTSLPEIVTTAVAAYHGEREIAVANVVGSNIFNLLGVLGLTATVSTLPIDSELYSFEVPVLAAATAALFLVAWTNRRIVRVEGIALIALFVIVLGVVLARGGL